MKILIACEFSGIVRDAFIARGHDALSCDFLDTERPGPHIKGDVLREIQEHTSSPWDLLIAFPPCTYLCNSGVRWLHERKGRWLDMEKAARFFRALLWAPIEKIAVENPVPHKYAVEIIGSKYDQTIQPYDFGHGETKRTCLWLRGLPPLMATSVVPGRKGRVHRESPGPDRWKNRSRTYQGIADAMADQWGKE